jgi:sugar O-acyltransferase (sialic acid O-acetyltransferase NeuD family)
MENAPMKDIVVIGSSGHAKVIIDIIEKQKAYKIIGLIDKFKNKGDTVFGYQIIGEEGDLPEISKNICGGIIAIGDNCVRYNVASHIKDIIPNFRFITAIHPFTAIAKAVKIGDGSVVMAGAIINSESTIGGHCIINTKASIDHNNSIGDFVTIAPNATLGGNVRVGDYSAISLGANVIHGISIGEHTIIGAGSTVIEDILSYVVAYGTPAKEIRKRKTGDKYL